MLHKETITPELLEVLQSLMSMDELAAFQLVGGAEYAITPKWRLTADARWLRVGSVRLDNEVGNPGGGAGPLKYNPLSVQVGLRYSF